MTSNSPLASALEDSAVLQSITLLLKCFKIMENATFLSKNNQARYYIKYCFRLLLSIVTSVLISLFFFTGPFAENG
jgi:Wings apart-like protein regulation of heterochromatin